MSFSRVLRERAALWAGSVTSGLPNSASRAPAAAPAFVGGASGSSDGVQLSREVVVEVRDLENNSGGRLLWAATPVSAPPEMVWRTLTDYERLAGVKLGEGLGAAFAPVSENSLSTAVR